MDPLVSPPTRRAASARLRPVVVVALLLLMGLLGPRAWRAAFPPETKIAVRVGVASSLVGVVRPLLPSSESVSIELVSASSGRIVNQLEAGAAFDLLLLASPGLMDRLGHSGRIDPETRRDLAGNRLVVAERRPDAPAGGGSEPSKIRRLALAEPETVPLGRYTRQAIAGGGVRTPLPREVVYGASAAQVAAFLRAGEVDLAVLYASDAGPSSPFRVVERIDPASHDPIRYPAAVVSDARHPEAAARVLDSLSSGLARPVFEEAGFTAPPE